MGIQLDWDDEAKTTLRCAFDPQWTWDDLYAVTDKVKAITDNAPHTVAAILDMRGGITIPGGNFFSPATLENARRLLTLGEGGTGPVVIVGATGLIKMVYETFKGMDRRAAAANITFVDTLEDARAHLATVHGRPDKD
jgi:ABC-type glycerol-3-phosphate transport system substrate-binding protein